MPSGGTPLTEAEKEQFLHNIRSGMDRGQAAKAIGKTGTMIGKLVREGCVRYDHQFHLAYSQALKDRDHNAYLARERSAGGAPPNVVTARGYTKARYITPEQIEQFLELVTGGEAPDLAAKEIGTSLRQLETRMGQDPEFSANYKEALKVGYPMFQEALRGEYVRQALKNGNQQALRDLAMVHLEEFDKLRTSKHEITGRNGAAIQFLTARLPDLPPEIVQTLIDQLEDKKKRQEIDA